MRLSLKPCSIYIRVEANHIHATEKAPAFSALSNDLAEEPQRQKNNLRHQPGDARNHTGNPLLNIALEQTQ